MVMKGSQRQYLRGLAHSLRPAVQVGRGGLTEPVATEVDRALTAHELVKVQIAAERDERRQIAEAVAAKLGCEWVGGVGRMAIFYRQHPDPERRSVVLPG